MNKPIKTNNTENKKVITENITENKEIITNKPTENNIRTVDKNKEFSVGDAVTICKSTITYCDGLGIYSIHRNNPVYVKRINPNKTIVLSETKDGEDIGVLFSRDVERFCDN